MDAKLKTILNNFEELPLSCEKKISIAFDCDDLLFECIEPALERTNRLYNLNLTEDKMTHWGYDEGDYAKVYECFNDPEFVANQKPLKGARPFIKELSKIPGVVIYFITAVPSAMMAIRAESLAKHFPTIDQKNFILSSSKHVASFDIFVDDAPHNVFNNNSEYVIVKRKSWNQNITGMLSYSNFDELWVIITSILKKKHIEIDHHIEIPSVFALIGPSGGEKNKIARLLCKAGMERPISYTTRKKAEDNEDNYHFISNKEFEILKKQGFFFETTVYGKNKFGLPNNAISDILSKGKNAVTVVDMCGMAALKARYPTIAIYVDKRYEVLLRNILVREYELEEQINRIIALQSERNNRKICDYLLSKEDSIEESAQRIINLFR